MESQDAVTSLSALAHEARLHIFRLLVVAGPAGLTPGALADELGIPAATLSFHLKELSHAELVTQERSGRHLIYRAAFDRMNALLAYLTANCCQGETCAPAAGTAPVSADPSTDHEPSHLSRPVCLHRQLGALDPR